MTWCLSLFHRGLLGRATHRLGVAVLSSPLLTELPRQPSVPAARIGRLAVDRRVQRHGLVGAFLPNAATRALRCEVAVFTLVIEAKDDEAAAYYRHHGFTAVASNPLQRASLSLCDT